MLLLPYSGQTTTDGGLDLRMFFFSVAHLPCRYVRVEASFISLPSTIFWVGARINASSALILFAKAGRSLFPTGSFCLFAAGNTGGHKIVIDTDDTYAR